MHGKIDTTQ
jgi:chromosome segregation ATPase